jgi:hypothetical protein
LVFLPVFPRKINNFRRPGGVLLANRQISLFLDGQYFLIFVLDGFESLISFSSHACAADDALPG